MSFDKKLPSIRLKVGKKDFNKLLELLETAKEINDEEYKNKAEKMEEKLMKYSFVHEFDEVEIRLFPIEAEFIMSLLLCYVKAMEIREDYYEKLVSNKEKYKEDNKRKENN